MSIAASNPGPLVGRNAEIELLASLLDGIQDGGSVGLAAGGGGAALAACGGSAALAAGGGGALVLYGEPGIGKSRLLAVAAGLARERGFTVLSATGVQSEAHLPFAGLHQLVHPLRSRLTHRGAGRREPHRRLRAVRPDLRRTRRGPALRRLRGRRTPSGPGEPGPPSDHRVRAHRRACRSSAAHRPDQRSTSARETGRSCIR